MQAIQLAEWKTAAGATNLREISSQERKNENKAALIKLQLI